MLRLVVLFCWLLSPFRPVVASCAGLPSFAAAGQDILQTLDLSDNLGQYKRNYGVRLPVGYSGFERRPVLFYFHWWGAPWPWEIFKINQLADKEGYILVSPEGMQDGQPSWRSWNVETAGLWDICTTSANGKQYASCQSLQKTSRCNCFTCYDDVGFVAQVYRDLVDTFCVAEHEVFGFGLSNGGMFLYSLIAELARRALAPHFKGVVVFDGGIFRNQIHEVPGTALFVHHGSLDKTIPLYGGEGADHWLWSSLEEILGRYAGVNGCSGDWQWLDTPFTGSDKFNGCFRKQGCDLQPVVRCLYSGDHNVFFDAYSPELLFWQIAMVRKAWSAFHATTSTVATTTTATHTSSTATLSTSTVTMTTSTTTTTIEVERQGLLSFLFDLIGSFAFHNYEAQSPDRVATARVLLLCVIFVILLPVPVSIGLYEWCSARSYRVQERSVSAPPALEPNELHSLLVARHEPQRL